VKASGFPITSKRLAESAPKVEGTLARLPVQEPGWIYTTSDHAMRGCERLRLSSGFAVTEPHLLVTAPGFTLTDSEITLTDSESVGKGSEQRVHSSDSVSNPAGLGRAPGKHESPRSVSGNRPIHPNRHAGGVPAWGLGLTGEPP
jgi:hypothetical protein